jgi:hypothetical protein
MLAAMPHLLQDVANLARNIWTMIRMVSSKIPAWLNQPSDEHMQVVRNSKASQQVCAFTPTNAACRTLGSGRKPSKTGMPFPSEA